MRCGPLPATFSPRAGPRWRTASASRPWRCTISARAMKSWRAFLRLVEPHPGRRRTRAGGPRPAISPACWPAPATPRPRSMPSPMPSSTPRRTGCRRSPGTRSAPSWRTLRSSAETASLTNSLRTRISAAMDRAEARVERWPLDELSFSDVAEGLRADYRRARHLIPDDWRAASAQTCTSCASAWWCIAIRWRWSSRCGRGSGGAGSREAQKLRNRLGTLSGSRGAGALRRAASAAGALALAAAIGDQPAAGAACAAARRIAGRLFAEKPKAFRRRLEAMWDGMAASR